MTDHTTSAIEQLTPAAAPATGVDVPVFPEMASLPAVAEKSGKDPATLMDVHLSCYFELGVARLSVSEVLDLTHGSVVRLDRMIGEPGKFVVAGQEFAHAEVVSIEGGYYGIRITGLIAHPRGNESS